jgi:hypothetical protein
MFLQKYIFLKSQHFKENVGVGAKNRQKYEFFVFL